MMKKLGATKVLVVGNLKTASEHEKAILDATDGTIEYNLKFYSCVKNSILIFKKRPLKNLII